MDILHYIHEKGYTLDKNTCHVAANGRNMDVPWYAHENGRPLDENTCYEVANGGNMDVLRYAYLNADVGRGHVLCGRERWKRGHTAVCP